MLLVPTERAEEATMDAKRVDQSCSKKRKERSSSPSTGRIVFTRSRSQVFLHISRSGHVRPDVYNKRTIELQSSSPKPRIPKDDMDHHASSSSEEEEKYGIRSPNPRLRIIIKDLRARRVFSPSTSIVAAAAAGGCTPGGEEEEKEEDHCHSEDVGLLDKKATKMSSNSFETNENGDLQFDSEYHPPDLEFGDGDDPQTVACFDEKGKLLPPLEAGYVDDYEGEKEHGKKNDSKSDGVSDIQKSNLFPKVDEDDHQSQIHTPPNNKKEDMSIIAHNRSENTQNGSAAGTIAEHNPDFLSTAAETTRIPFSGGAAACCGFIGSEDRKLLDRKVGLVPVSRLKLFHTPNSLSYRRMLPFLMDLTKENSSTLEVLPRHNFPVEVAKSVGHERPPYDHVKDGDGDTKVTPLHLGGLETPETKISTYECLRLESLKQPIIIKEISPENQRPLQYPVSQSTPPSCVTANHNFSVNVPPNCHTIGIESRVIYPATSGSCSMSTLPKNGAGASNSETEVAPKSLSFPSIGSDALSLNGCIAAHPSQSSDITAQEESATPPVFKSSIDAIELRQREIVDIAAHPSQSSDITPQEESVTPPAFKSSIDAIELRPREIVDILPPSSPIPFKDQHFLPPVSCHPDAKIESPIPSSIGLLHTDCSLPPAKIPLVSEKSNLAPTKGILKMHLRECKGLCMCPDCASFRLHAEEAYEFCRKQMQDAEQMTVGLMKELSSLQSLMEKSIASVPGSNGCHAIIQHGQVKRFCKRAAGAEELAMQRLRQMRQELKIRCRINLMQQRPPTPRMVKFSDDVKEKLIPKEEPDS